MDVKENTSGLEAVEDEVEAEPGGDVETGLCGDGDCVSGVVVVIVGCLSEADAVGGALNLSCEGATSSS